MLISFHHKVSWIHGVYPLWLLPHHLESQLPHYSPPETILWTAYICLILCTMWYLTSLTHPFLNPLPLLLLFFIGFFIPSVGPGASLVAQMVKNLSAKWETWVQSLGRVHPLEKGTATQSSILYWRIPCTEKPGGLQSMRSQRVGHDWATNTLLAQYTWIKW